MDLRTLKKRRIRGWAWEEKRRWVRYFHTPLTTQLLQLSRTVVLDVARDRMIDRNSFHAHHGRCRMSWEQIIKCSTQPDPTQAFWVWVQHKGLDFY